jgi:(R)-2-hydroxyacyl-CoA dehydratese activating ATPase
MIVVGCDFGTLAAKVVVMKDGSIVSSEIGTTRAMPEKVANDLLSRALSKAGLFQKDVDYSISTGWGRKRVPFANMGMGDMPCLAKGAQWLIPSVRTVIDIGGQSSRALNVNEAGRVIAYNTNDKCAAGTGRFIELVTEALELSLEELASLASQSKDPAKISSQCCVFAESEVVALVNEGRDIVDIVAGVHDSIVRRLTAVTGTISISKDVVMTGGCAKNERLVASLGNQLKVEVKKLTVDPQFVGAIGAAVFAQEKLSVA